MMTIDFLIGAIRASRDLHPKVQTELEEIRYKAEMEARRRAQVINESRQGFLAI